MVNPKYFSQHWNLQSVLGDVNLDGEVNLLDVQPFVVLLQNSGYQDEADINQDGLLNLLDVEPFVSLLAGDNCVRHSCH